MVAGLLAALFLSIPSQQEPNPPTFQDAATAALYAKARVRHVRQDSLVRDYQAVVHSRLDLTVGRSRFARQTTLLAHESVSRVTWQRPNDLKIHALGVRTAAPVLGLVGKLTGDAQRDVKEDFRQEVWLDRPWFIPRALGDSIRLMGVPEQAALHPMGDGAVDYYTYAITDSFQISVPGRRVRAVKMHVRPKRLAPSLVAGDMWIDSETGDVVRMFIVFVGEFLWEQPESNTPSDSAEAREDNKWANRFLSVEADIEYGLIDRQYWLPHRQFLAITIEIPWFINAAMPVRAVSRFDEYRVNQSPDISFVVPLDESDESGKAGWAATGEERSTRVRVKPGAMDADSAVVSNSERQYRNGYVRAGTWSDGRWEVDVPPAESLLMYEWTTDFKVAQDEEEERRLRESLAVLADISEQLPDQWVGRMRFHAAWEQFSDLYRFNRVQGPSVGLGYLWRPGLSYTSVLATGRFGIADKRPTGSLVLRRDSPSGRFDLTGFRTVREVEPWTNGLGFSNSLNAMFAGNDDADYLLALGGGISHEWHTGALRNVEFSALFERQRNMVAEADAPLPNLFGNGGFQPNASIQEGDFLVARVERVGGLGSVRLLQGAGLQAGDGLIAGRFWGMVAIPFGIFRRTGSLTFRGGLVRGDTVPQLEFRLGGPQTVRGHTYGTRTGREFWSAQLDFAVFQSRMLSPVVFADVGDTFDSDPLVGVGAGLSFLNGFARLSLSKGFRPSRDIRFDLAFRAPR